MVVQRWVVAEQRLTIRACTRDQEEELASPDTLTTPDMRRNMPPTRHSVQALELDVSTVYSERLGAGAPISEYEDGGLAWSIANVLRTDGRDGTESLASHSPQLSISSRRHARLDGGSRRARAAELENWCGTARSAAPRQGRSGAAPNHQCGYAP